LPLGRQVFLRRNSVTVTSIEYAKLLIHRSDIGGVGLSWYSFNSTFIPEPKDTNRFLSKSVTIRSIRDFSSFERLIKPQKDFERQLSIGFKEWLENCATLKEEGASTLKLLKHAL
ncbi:MAG: hypothetical protein M3Q80_02980, partial [bacterium]|nr:hypothetical protein [bacterium]